LLSLAALLLSACIPIPYKPSATAALDDSLAVSPNHLVSCSPDPTTDALARKIASLDRNLTVVSLGDIAAAAFPDGDARFEQLTDPGRLARLRQDFGLAYVVLVGELTSQELSRHGGFVPLLGAGTSTEATGLSVSIIDLEHGRPLTGISAVAKGRTSGVIYGFYGIILTPMSETSVRDAISKAVVDAVRTTAGQEHVRIAIARVIGLQSSTCIEGAECSHEPVCADGVDCQNGTTGQPSEVPLPSTPAADANR
jgi:hypothetical protein